MTFLKKVLKYCINHNSLIQFVLFIILVIFQVVLTVKETDSSWLILVGFGFISAELFQISLLIEFGNNKSKNDSFLKKRSGHAIKEIALACKHEVFITGLNNNSAINSIYNDADLIDYLVKNKIKVNLLFLDSNDYNKFNWFCRFFFGKKDTDKDCNVVKDQQKTSINQLYTYDVLNPLISNSLLEIRFIDSPMSTAFVAGDPIKREGKIQCIFYQFGVSTADCPSVILDKKDEMYDKMCSVLINMWNQGTPYMHT